MGKVTETEIRDSFQAMGLLIREGYFRVAPYIWHHLVERVDHEGIVGTQRHDNPLSFLRLVGYANEMQEALLVGDKARAQRNVERALGQLSVHGIAEKEPKLVYD